MSEMKLEPYAVEQYWCLPSGFQDWNALFSEYLETLTKTIAQHDRSIIGHIKALALFPGGEYIQLSVTNAREQASIKGYVPEGVSQLKLNLNVIVYGPDYELVEKITDELAIEMAKKWNGEVRKIKLERQPGSGQHDHHNH